MFIRAQMRPRMVCGEKLALCVRERTERIGPKWDKGGKGGWFLCHRFYSRNEDGDMNEYRGGFKRRTWFMAAILAAFVAGCGSGDDLFGTSGAGAGGGPGAGTCAAGNLPLASAASFGVLAGTALTITNPTSVTGDVGSPSITPAAGPSTLVGTMYDSTPASELTVISTAVTDMQTAVGCAVARPCNFSYGAATDFGGMSLAPGVHCVAGAMSVGSNLTLSTPGVYIFRATGALTSAATVIVALGGSANAGNTSVFWVSSGAASGASIGATNTFLGTITVDPGAATLGANTTLLNGRVLSSSAVTLSTNTIAIP